MANSKLSDLSIDFAVKVLKLCSQIKGHSSLVNQLERSATSIGANIREANYAHSRADFIAKLQISLKECYETEYWLELLQRADLVSSDVVSPIIHTCGSLRRMLVSSVNTAKKNRDAD
ncbi:MAG: four helix bundle protein [Oscillospiraceae bacterium]|nr:four helix bundle protein [Oscillospiraceae bacterium]MBR0211323.1 four helix bundle protein [Oscillospiraceae bacterium]